MNNTTDQSDAANRACVAEQLGQALSARFSSAAVQLDGPISVRDNSQIFHALITGEVTVEAAIKQCTGLPNKGLDETEAQRQFAALTRVSNAFAGGNDRYRVPAPIIDLPGMAAYAMSWINGASLTRKLGGISAFVDGERWFVEVGAWLARFHRSGPCRKQSVDLAERLEVIDTLEATPLPDAPFRSALRTLRANAQAFQGTPVTFSWIHGDCKVDNFMVCGNELFGLDISLVHENAIEYDLAQFLNNVQLSLFNPRRAHLLAIRPRLECAFWQGYNAAGPTVSQPFLSWLRLAFCLAFWHKMAGLQNSIFRRKILDFVFSRLTTRLEREIVGHD